MSYTPAQADFVLDQVRGILARDEPGGGKAERALRTLLYTRACLLSNILRNRIGERVFSGPFRGMKLLQKDGPYAPHLLGIYEQELHPAIEAALARPYRNILNIGCAIGYYSTGLALRMRDARVFAFDTDPEAQEACRALAAANDMSERVTVEGAFEGKDFAAHAGEKTLVFMDIEEAERSLLDPGLYPALKTMDVIVELHDVIDKTISDTVPRRFAATHDVKLIPNRPAFFDLAAVTGPDIYNDPLDCFLIAWENRTGPTPWAVMTVKDR